MASKNTFKAAQKIVFSKLRITKVDLPDSSARAIYKEYIEREKKETAEKNCREINVCDEEEDTSKDDEDDFWGDSDSTAEASSNSSNEDDFWGNSETSENENAKPKDDFWGEASVESKSSGNNDRVWGTGSDDFSPVSYTHLTLPTICRV